MKKPDYYSILQVSRDATAEVISSAYRTIMLKLKKHPDLGGDSAEAQRIGEAYAVLSDSEQRRRYDDSLDLMNSSNETASTSEKKNYDGIERRRAERKTVDAEVSFCVGDKEKWCAGRAKDASVLGLRIQTKDQLAVGEHLVIVGAQGGAGMHGVVRWQRTAHASVFERIYEVGVEFFDQISDVVDRLAS